MRRRLLSFLVVCSFATASCSAVAVPDLSGPTLDARATVAACVDALNKQWESVSGTTDEERALAMDAAFDGEPQPEPCTQINTIPVGDLSQEDAIVQLEDGLIPGVLKWLRDQLTTDFGGVGDEL